MSETQALIKMLDYGYLDFKDAFKRLKTDHLHKRPTERALAISEIAGHIAYCEAGAIYKTLFKVPQSEWPIESPLFHESYNYPPPMLKNLIRNELLELNVDGVRDEALRVHGAVMNALSDFDEDVDNELAGAWGVGGTLRSHLSYLGYHVSYHTGQIFLTRHFFGEQTPEQ